YLCYVKGGAFYQMPLPGGTAIKLITNMAGPVVLSPDGRQLAFVREDLRRGETALMRANADGSGEQKLATRTRPSQINNESVTWSPDGEMIAFCVWNIDATDQYNSAVAVRVMDGRETRLTAQRWQFIRSLAWLSDGRRLVMLARDQTSPSQIWYLSYPGGEARRITNDLQTYRSLSLTADSRTLVTVQGESVVNLWVTRPGNPNLAD